MRTNEMGILAGVFMLLCLELAASAPTRPTMPAVFVGSGTVERRLGDQNLYGKCTL